MHGDELQALRARAGWTQSQLATGLKVTPQYVGMMERGEKEIKPHMEEAIHTVLDDTPKTDRYVPDGKRYREAKLALLTSLKKRPEVTLNGFPYFGLHKDSFEAAKAEHESRAEFFSDDSLAQIATALAWIDTIKITKKPKIGSYGAKHTAEQWGSKNGFSSYVANGALLIAAIYRDVPMKPVLDTPNAQLALDPDPMPEARAGSFVEWLRGQTKTPGMLGDLARDAAQDRTFPIDTSSGPKLRAYLRSQRACEGAIDALDEALLLWRARRT